MYLYLKKNGKIKLIFYLDKNMLKRFIIILAIFHINLAFAQTSDTSTPHSVAVNVLENTLLSLKALQEKNADSSNNIEDLVLSKLIPNVAIDFASKIILRDRWNDLSYEQQSMFVNYITRSIVQDYVGLMSSYKKMNDLNIEIKDGGTFKDDKALIKLHISVNKNNYQYFINLKMVKLDRWYIYDAVFPGVSILKHYQKNFDSIIKRKGMNGLISIISNN